jgi:hypothetical protein
MFIAKNLTYFTRFKKSHNISHLAKANLERPMWYPGAQAPPHLKGEMIGDYGFDPLRIGVNSDLICWLREAEINHGRWAMAAVAGILLTEAIGIDKWWEAGAKSYSIDTPTLIIIELVVMTIFEAKRFENIKKTGESGLLAFAPFDPMNMRSDEMRLKEIKNGRLAMFSFLGFSSQAAVLGLGPIQSLKKHLENPYENNIFTSEVGPETTLAVGLASIAPILIEAKKNLSDNDEDTFRPIPW